MGTHTHTRTPSPAHQRLRPGSSSTALNSSSQAYPPPAVLLPWSVYTSDTTLCASSSLRPSSDQGTPAIFGRHPLTSRAPTDDGHSQRQLSATAAVSAPAALCCDDLAVCPRARDVPPRVAVIHSLAHQAG